MEKPEGDQQNIKYLHDLISLRTKHQLMKELMDTRILSMFFNSSEKCLLKMVN